MRSRPAVGIGAERSNRTHHEFKRTLNLRAISFRRIELLRKEDRLQSFANVAVRLHECRSNAFDECGRRIIRYEVTDQFRGDELRGRRMMREDVEHHQSVFYAPTCRNLVTENHLLAVVMCAGVEEERTGSATHRIADARAEDSRTTATGIGTHALKVVEIKKHRRALGGRFEQLRKLRQRVWANGVAIV